VSKLPTFCINNLKPDFEITPFQRAVAIILVNESLHFKKTTQLSFDLTKTQIVVYNRKDKILRLPGGHVESGESMIQTAQRETQEEIGLPDLNFLAKKGSCNLFYKRGDKISFVQETFLQFSISQKSWQNRTQAEAGIFPKLVKLQDFQSQIKSDYTQFVWKQIIN